MFPVKVLCSAPIDKLPAPLLAMESAVISPLRVSVCPLATLIIASFEPAAAPGLKDTVEEIVGLLPFTINPPLRMVSAPPVMP